jgi:RNA polymerase sigma-70 factor (sigma-E family)
VDADELAELYQRHVPAVRGFAVVLTSGNLALAEDLVHDAFIRTAGRLAAIRDPAAFEAYLRRAVTNAFMSWQRRQRIEWRWIRGQQSSCLRSTEQDSAASVEGANEVHRLLAQLPARQRVAVAARFCLDLSEAQTADLLGCSVGTVKALTSRGLAKLRQLEGVELRQ